jgi:endonuclease YncB( thermonuclease family)
MKSITLPCRVADVYDGDTITVEITIPARVRLLDCWAPELNEEGGKESRDNLKKLAMGKRALIEVPWDTSRSLGNLFSFDRLLGKVFVDERTESLNEVQVSCGFASKSRK